MNIDTLFAEKSVSIREIWCSSCRFQFTTKDLTIETSRCPILLPCGHSSCKSCILQKLKSFNNFECVNCGFVSTPEVNEKYHNELPVNFYILGVLTALEKYEKNKKLLFCSAQKTHLHYLAKEKLKGDKSITNCEECSIPAYWFCENCQTDFCEICWLRIHQSAKTLMKHKKISISDKKMTQKIIKKCSVHKFQNLEFYCKNCCMALCPQCVMLQHKDKGHNTILLELQNMEMINKVKIAAVEAEKVCKRMVQTLEKMNLDSSADDHLNREYLFLESSIARNYLRLHGILQLEEERLMKRLRKAAQSRDDHLRNLSIQLKEQIQEIRSLLKDYQEVADGPFAGDMSDLYKRLIEANNLPCYLISHKNIKKDLKVSFNDDLIELLRGYCTLELPPNDDFELCSGNDLPQDYIVETLELNQFGSYQAEKGSDPNTSELETSSDTSSKSDVKTENNGKVKGKYNEELLSESFSDRKIYSVRVTYIKSPEEFYVALNSRWPKQRLIEKRASELAEHAPVPAKVSKDETYLVKFKGDEKFYRARVIKVLPSNNKGKEVVLVHYLDYGNTEEVFKTRLRIIPSELSEEAPLAIKCKLFDCVPKNGNWSRESTEVMAQMLENSTVTMFVMKIHQDCLEVDLSKVHPKSHRSSEIVSVRDAMVFLEFACFVRGPETSCSTKSSFEYPNQGLPSEGESCRVIVTHVDSPSDFYVQREKPDALFLCKLSNDMQKYYSLNSREGVIYNPLIGMPCAAIFSEDRKWYRGKILEILDKKLLNVVYVDFGNRAVLPWTCVRKLKECFIKSPPLALHCALAGIRPRNSKSWNIGAVEFTKQYLEQKICLMKVEEKNKMKNILLVHLQENADGKEMSFNDSLIRTQYASRSDSRSVINNFESSFADDEGNSPLFLEEDKLEKDKKEEMKSSAFENDLELECLEHEANFPYSNFKIKVEVLSAESPSSIYLTFSALKEVLASLEIKLNEFYGKSGPVNDVEWTVGNKCVVYSSAKKGWYRAKILEILPSKKAKVFLKDVALISWEPLTSLRVLDQSFSKFATCSIKCHLSDIRAVGSRWPDVSCEFLLQELNTYEDVYATRKGEIKEKSLPVELWTQIIVPGAALEPSLKKWITFNGLLVEQGLAIPDKLQLMCPAFLTGQKESVGGSGVKDEETKMKRNCDVLSPTEEESKICKAFVAPLLFRWLPPAVVDRTDFVGMPTYVDLDASVYIHSIEQEKQLKTMRQELMEQYGKSNPSSDDHFWSPGQTCMVRFHMDGFWYRGSVVEVNDNSTYEVLFVDYGNIETCQASEMRKKIQMTETPILTSKFRLSGIVPATEDGKWPVASIEILHSAVVDKYCQVVIVEPSSDCSKPPAVLLKILNKDIDVGTFLVENGLARFEEKSQNISVHTQVSQNSNTRGNFKKYVAFDVPENFTKFNLKITTIVSETEFFGCVACDDSTPFDVKQVFQTFQVLQRNMQIDCPDQPALDKLEIGQACCYYAKNQKWHRAEVEAFGETDLSVCIFYVDSGHKEFVKKNLLRECKDEWLNVPKMALRFRLANVEKCPDVPKSAYVTALTKCLEQDFVLAEIIRQNKELLEIKLFNKENGTLAYQQMIDDILMRESTKADYKHFILKEIGLSNLKNNFD